MTWTGQARMEFTRVSVVLVMTALCFMCPITSGTTDENSATACSCSQQSPGMGQQGVNPQPFLYMVPQWPVIPGYTGLPTIKGEKGAPGECGACKHSIGSTMPLEIHEGGTENEDQWESQPSPLISHKGEKGEQGIQGLEGQQGPTGATGLKGNRGDPGQVGAPGPPGTVYSGLAALTKLEQEKVQATKNVQQDGIIVNDESKSQMMKVAFTVAMDDNIGPLEDPGTLKFKQVTSNIGDGYNTETGEFSAPVPGTYIFTYHILGQHSRPMEVVLVKNGKMINSVHSRGTGGYTGVSNSAVLDLQKGDTVSLMLSAGIYYIYGETGYHTTFTGYLIYPE